MKKITLITLMLFSTASLTLGGLYGYVEWYGRKTQPQKADVIIVLGAAVWPNGPSPALFERITLAERLYRQGYARAIITTGGVGHLNPTPEGTAAKQTIIALGIPADIVYAEVCSRNTRENLMGALKIMREHGWNSAIIVTHDFHLLRAMKEAHRLGIKAYGAGVHETAMFRPPMVFREAMANLVATFK
ncbi:uncharacterized SAM-binding protein YcdF (DUF218 family) [Desulfofundulus luciae]|uniref:Uncharacterized SAM-binding protein YcdF (DUF218 family) n=1 Tax=Desulfofundulus luciae TaxID=74702 RepID=A0ABU0B0G0_9FIRM|nr:YdcF family protein [Desulfofundulus luciae]MDQ0286190.1 uncharacterized SAM-binding protein YcdF (DUF218 family) [Desulfofundulus luciae]